MDEQIKDNIKILFICHGNICRSPMAEFLFQDLVRRQNMESMFHIASAATSREEIGNPVHRGTRDKLRQHGISTAGKYAVRMEQSDYDKYDYLIAMDHYNLTNMNRIINGDPQGKVHLLMDFTDRPRDVADPWYTGDFDQTYEDVLEGCNGLLHHILNNL